MATARFHSLRGNSSALVGIRANAFALGNTFVYINRSGVIATTNKTDQELQDINWEDNLEFDIPDGYKIATMIGEDGVARTTKDGEELKQLVW